MVALRQGDYLLDCFWRQRMLLDCLQDTFVHVCNIDAEGVRAGTIVAMAMADILRYPTIIPRDLALDAIGEADLQWFVERDILTPLSTVEYGLLDEFLRVRLVLDAARPEKVAYLEQRLLQDGQLLSLEELEELEDDDDDA